jgi:hypothetical protein
VTGSPAGTVSAGSDAMLKRMNKTEETEPTVAETIDLIERARPDFYRAQLWYCDLRLPKTSSRQVRRRVCTH